MPSSRHVLPYRPSDKALPVLEAAPSGKKNKFIDAAVLSFSQRDKLMSLCFYMARICDIDQDGEQIAMELIRKAASKRAPKKFIRRALEEMNDGSDITEAVKEKAEEISVAEIELTTKGGTTKKRPAKPAAKPAKTVKRSKPTPVEPKPGAQTKKSKAKPRK